MPDTNKTIKLQGSAACIVVPLAEKQDYVQRGKNIELKVIAKKVRS